MKKRSAQSSREPNAQIAEKQTWNIMEPCPWSARTAERNSAAVSPDKLLNIPGGEK